MHHLRNSRDRIDGTDLCAEIAADTKIFVYSRDAIEAGMAKIRAHRLGFSAQHTRKLAYRFVSPRRTAIDGCVAGGYGYRVGTAAGVTALRALDSG